MYELPKIFCTGWQEFQAFCSEVLPCSFFMAGLVALLVLCVFQAVHAAFLLTQSGSGFNVIFCSQVICLCSSFRLFILLPASPFEFK